MNTAEIQAKYNTAYSLLADALFHFDFKDRERLILNFIRKGSFGVGRTTAQIPALDFFCRAAHISRGNVSSILYRLKACQVIKEEPEHYYGFVLMPADINDRNWVSVACKNWRVPVRGDEVEVIRQLELLPFPPSLDDALREIFIESITPTTGKPGGAPGTFEGWPGASDPTAGQPRAHIGVPELGTIVPNSGTSAHRSRIGNDKEIPVFAGISYTVPESGTPIIALQQCSNAPSKEHNCIVANMPVPDSGTDVVEKAQALADQGWDPSRPHFIKAIVDRPTNGKFSPEQQEMFDWLEKKKVFTTRPGDSFRPFWIGMVRDRPTVVAVLIGALVQATRDPYRRNPIMNPGGWMIDLWKRDGKPDKCGL